MTPDIKTIVYATGLGGGAPHVFRYALSLARQYQAKIEIVCGMESFRQYSHEVAAIYIGAKDTSIKPGITVSPLQSIMLDFFFL